MMTCYFDESGGDDLKWTYVCGYVASVEQWKRFEVDWKIFLAKYDVPYFHMKEYSQSKGPFSGWKAKRMEGTRARFTRDAASIIGNHVQQSFVALVSHDIFDEADRIYDFRKVFNSPYALAGRMSVGLAIDWRMQSVKGPLDMEYIFEDGCPDKEGLIHSMTALVPYLEVPAFRPSRDFAPSPKWPRGRVGFVQLQAADFLAYENRKMLCDRDLIKSGYRKIRASLLALSKVPLHLCLAEPQTIDRICTLANITRRELDGNKSRV